MEKTKLTVRVERKLLENAKHYAAEHNTTLTDLINTYLQQIHTGDILGQAPIVRRISGTLSQDLSVRDYKEHLEEKYAR